MTRAYLRLDPGFDEAKYDYPDGPFAALIATFCVAERQPTRGEFRSLDYLRRVLGKRGKHVQYLVEHKDIVVRKDGRVYVDGWDEWQEGDRTVAERVARIRARRSRNEADYAPANGDVTPDVTADRKRSYSGDVTERSGDDERADLEAFLLVTRRAPTEKQRRLLDDLLDRHDINGPQWAADIILRNPADPIGALIKADTAYREERIAEAIKAEKPKPTRRTPRLPDSVREFSEWTRMKGDDAA